MTTLATTRSDGTGPRASDTQPTAQVIAGEITTLLEQLRPLANQVHALVDSYQPTLSGRIDPDAQAAINLAIRAERAGRVDTTTRPVGQSFMRGTTSERPLGTHAEAGRGQAVSSDANIAFTLKDNVGRLHASLRVAGVGVCVLPRLGQDPTPGHLARHLAALVHQAAGALPPALAIPKLRDLKRELEWLVNEADVVIDGTGQMQGGHCPHCGRPTITIDFRKKFIRCDVDRTTGRLERCVCGDDYCLCRFKPVEFRHEWHQNAALKRDGWDRFKRLTTRPKKASDRGPKHATKWGVATCPKDGEPLVSTLEWAGYEFICMVCRTKYEFLSPTPAPETPELMARHDELAAQYDAERKLRTQAERAERRASREAGK